MKFRRCWVRGRSAKWSCSFGRTTGRSIRRSGRSYGRRCAANIKSARACWKATIGTWWIRYERTSNVILSLRDSKTKRFVTPFSPRFDLLRLFRRCSELQSCRRSQSCCRHSSTRSTVYRIIWRERDARSPIVLSAYWHTCAPISLTVQPFIQ